MSTPRFDYCMMEFRLSVIASGDSYATRSAPTPPVTTTRPDPNNCHPVTWICLHLAHVNPRKVELVENCRPSIHFAAKHCVSVLDLVKNDLVEPSSICAEALKSICRQRSITMGGVGHCVNRVLWDSRQVKSIAHVPVVGIGRRIRSNDFYDLVSNVTNGARIGVSGTRDSPCTTGYSS